MDSANEMPQLIHASATRHVNGCASDPFSRDQPLVRAPMIPVPSRYLRMGPP